MSNSSLSFREAVEREEVEEAVKSLLVSYPELLEDNGGSAQNPFLRAYEQGSFLVAKEMATKWPELASIKNEEDGYTAMHIVSAKGDAEMVKFLGEHNPQSCLAEDNLSEIPLHIAAEKGHSDVIRALVNLCPQSLDKLTSNQETALHLALKHSKCDAFLVLMDEIKKLDQENLLNVTDNKGNTVLHIATVNRLVEIVELLVSELFNCETLISCRNNMGQTALDVCPAASEDEAYQEIYRILDIAATGEMLACPGKQSPVLSRSSTLAELSIEKRNVTLMVLVMIAVASFTITCNLPDVFLKEVYLNAAGEPFHAKDVLSFRLPTVFYLMMFNSAGFVTAMVMIIMLMWPLRFRTIRLFVVIFSCIVYAILVEKILPKFSVSFWTLSISSIALLWSLALAFIFFGVTIQYCVSLLHQFVFG